jgi:hypothetical protein
VTKGIRQYPGGPANKWRRSGTGGHGCSSLCSSLRESSLPGCTAISESITTVCWWRWAGYSFSSVVPSARAGRPGNNSRGFSAHQGKILPSLIAFALFYAFLGDVLIYVSPSTGTDGVTSLISYDGGKTWNENTSHVQPSVYVAWNKVED